MSDPSFAATSRRKPAWLRRALPQAPAYRATGALLESLRLHTVCQEARCPNKGECFSSGTATFLILGDRCTRDCRFCSVRHGDAARLDEEEPRRVAEAARRLGLRHVVVTSVTRDDLPDGGAGQFAATIAALRAEVPAATVEVLVPDFGGEDAALGRVLAAQPDVLNHNLETVPRLYPAVRAGADYERSLALLWKAAESRARAHAVLRRRQSRGASSITLSAATPLPGFLAAAALRPVVKTGLMVGLGERREEVHAVLRDCAAVGVDVVTVGQYLQPARDRAPVAGYWTPEEFSALEQVGAAMGLRLIAAPFVRSSYRAGELV